MASRTHVVLVDPIDDAREYARRRLQELERRWSRFLPSSDVSRLNATAGGLMLVSPDSLTLLAAMKEAWRRTQGRYDPTLLDAIVAAGYASSMDRPFGRRRSRTTGRGAPGSTIEDVAIDAVTGAVTVPSGIGLDPGGIGKGLAADIVVTELLERGTAGALVSIGGDLAAAGTPPTPLGWPVAVEDPRDRSRHVAMFVLEAGGAATSSTLSRCWLQDGARRHHVIDPDSRTSATTDLACTTVVARAGWEAEVHATAALLCGSEGALAYLEKHELDGVAVTLDGAMLTSPGLNPVPVPERSSA